MNKIDLTAKLLATENLTVIKAAVKTASFDIIKRQLTLPILSNMTPEIEDMLVAHEIGHALFTSEEMLEASKQNRRLHSYINVVEDVRSEKLTKRKYPGIRKTFTTGYNQLNDRDFFGINNIPDKSKLNLIDRINLWYKVGLDADVEFSEEEKPFLTRTEKTETVDDVIQLAKDIYAFSKREKEKQKKEEEKSKKENQMSIDEEIEEESEEIEESEENEEGESEDDGNSEEDESEDDGNSEEDESDESLDSITDKTFNKNLDELANAKFSYEYHTLSNDYDINTIVSYKTILTETSQSTYDTDRGNNLQEIAEQFTKFKTDTNKSISYLVKEFDMKKAATEYKRTQVSKSGSLDMKKIWGYQLNDDMFKRVTTSNKGKNHGMIFLLDWSGSMSSIMRDTIEQVIQLSSFCHRSQIPFQVLAFTSRYNLRSLDGYFERREARRQAWNNSHNSILVDGFSLLELFSDKMSNQEFNLMSSRLYNIPSFNNNEGYNLGSTPLNEALAYMTDYVGTFIRKNNIEKMSFITLTDGAGDALKSSKHLYSSIKHFINDPITKKSYPITSDAVEQTGVLLTMIKDRWNTTNLGFYVTGAMSRKELQSAVYYNGIRSNAFSITEQIKSDVRKNGYASIKTTGRDDLLLVPSKTLKIEDTELEVKSNQSVKAISKNFTKVLNGRSVNRLLLNRFISLIA